MPKIQAVLLDLDGTTLNTSELMCRAFEYAFSTANLPIPTRADIQSRMASGGTLESMYKSLNPSADPVALSKLHRIFESDHLSLGQPFADTIHILEKLQSANLKLAIVSNRSTATLAKLIFINNLNHFFQTVVSGDDTPTPKPSPAPILLALNHLNINAENAVMIGDTSADILSGQAAKTLTIGLTQGFTGPSIANFQPSKTTDNLSSASEFIFQQKQFSIFPSPKLISASPLDFPNAE